MCCMQDNLCVKKKDGGEGPNAYAPLILFDKIYIL